MSQSDTIVAPVTPPGMGAVGIVRISGSKAKEIAIALGAGELTARFAHYGTFKDDMGQVIDFGLYLYFNAPHSFTGEDVIELQGHGSPIVMDRLLQRILQLGARMAEPGEFSKRAFINDKMDLTQAEAIADLINSHSVQAAKLAIASLQGVFSKTINTFKEQLIALRLYIEGAIDFAEEEIEFLTLGNIQSRLSDLIDTLAHIMYQANQGHCLQEGVSVVIAGAPNAGKSSLLNQLSGQSRAIVTDVPGTTRDVLREMIQIDGIPLHIIDTAGLRKTGDLIESEGILRAQSEIKKADHILWVQDIKTSEKVDLQTIWAAIDPDAVLSDVDKKPSVTVICNKCDLVDKKASMVLEKDIGYTQIYLSAKTGEGITLLREHIKSLAGFKLQTEGIFLARRRHLHALDEAKQSLIAAQTQLIDNTGSELVAEELRQAQLALDKITGTFHSDDLLGEIFSQFCIGK